MKKTNNSTKRSAKVAKRPAPKAPTKSTPASMLKVVKTRMKRGDIGRVAGVTGYERSHVGRVLRGVRKNDSIVTAAYNMVTSR